MAPSEPKRRRPSRTTHRSIDEAELLRVIASLPESSADAAAAPAETDARAADASASRRSSLLDLFAPRRRGPSVVAPPREPDDVRQFRLAATALSEGNVLLGRGEARASLAKYTYTRDPLRESRSSSRG